MPLKNSGSWETLPSVSGCTWEAQRGASIRVAPLCSLKTFFVSMLATQASLTRFTILLFPIAWSKRTAEHPLRDAAMTGLKLQKQAYPLMMGIVIQVQNVQPVGGHNLSSFEVRLQHSNGRQREARSVVEPGMPWGRSTVWTLASTLETLFSHDHNMRTLFLK